MRSISSRASASDASELSRNWETGSVSRQPPNRLASETSPYLLQHARNPVDWYPWGTEALELAGRLERPIFLSIGYSACHWCHVMERESFEDEETARVLNDRFVPIKVDREERPDLDAIYMDAVQALTGQGGWPLSVFLTPDGRAFYGGTYFPPEPSRGMPSFRQVLVGISEAWEERREDVLSQGDLVLEALSRAGTLTASEEPLSEEVALRAMQTLRQAFDPRWGGFGGAPKFPQPMTLEFVLRMAVKGVPGALDMVESTLDHMANGGIRDHVGGGFARYSTDAAWHVPHFEKMLPDNAQLALLYARAWLATGAERHRAVSLDTLGYLAREMRHPQGGFWSSQDADSEGVEGRFFTWSWEELVGLVGEAVADALGATQAGNWAENGAERGEATNVLWRPRPLSEVAGEHGISVVELEAALAASKGVLLEARERRVRPTTDDKVLTAWNALAIRAFAEAGRAFGRPDLVAIAVEAAEFVLDHLRDGRGRLLRSWREGVPGRRAFADDHALLGLACVALFETTADPRWFEEASDLAARLLEQFVDPERGGFFQTATDDEPLVVRPKDLQDNAMPSGNSAAAELFLRLSLLGGDSELERAATSALLLVRDAMDRAPSGFGHALCALDLSVGPSREVAIVGDPGDEATRALVDEVVAKRYLPNVVLAVGAPADRRAERVPLLRARPAVDGRATAYVCEGFACRLPVTRPEDLASQLMGVGPEGVSGVAGVMGAAP
jgi:uncharacterized protein